MNAHESWLQERMTGIGGSDAAAVLGLSKWKTPLQVYQEKRGELLGQPDSEPMLWGRALEPVIRQQYAERTGRTVSIPKDIIRHPRYDFMIATIDGYTNDNRLLEVKTARSSNDWGEAGTDEVPQAYLIQVQHYLAVTQLAVADVAVLIGGSDYRQYEIKADSELQQMIIEAEFEFWEKVTKGIPPAPVSYADAVAAYGKSSKAESIEANREITEAVGALKANRDKIKTLEDEQEILKAKIMNFLGERDSLTIGGKTAITWKAQAGSKRFDSKTFEIQQPDLYKQFIAVGEPSRKFLIK